ncbi:MAG: hypothetical protein CL913_00235 [Deltaproteobacteria bacterium]|nr:hypothetical protein [Deltaproteobacteria bacterium]
MAGNPPGDDTEERSRFRVEEKSRSWPQAGAVADDFLRTKPFLIIATILNCLVARLPPSSDRGPAGCVERSDLICPQGGELFVATSSSAPDDLNLPSITRHQPQQNERMCSNGLGNRLHS